MKLSAYTIAKNCSDLADIEAGIEELNNYLQKARKPIKSSYIRLYKLSLLKTKMLNENKKNTQA